jgi:hypothetical protein
MNNKQLVTVKGKQSRSRDYTPHQNNQTGLTELLNVIMQL